MARLTRIGLAAHVAFAVAASLLGGEPRVLIASPGQRYAGADEIATSPILGASILASDNSDEPPPFADSFDADHNYLADGLGQRGWDGLLGKRTGETADRIQAASGKLFLQSTRGRYQEPWKPLGPLLFKTVAGDFKATVRVIDYESVSYNNCGIMARVANLDDAGPGEDWISVDYFPIYGGIYARMANDNRRTEEGSNGQGRGADRFLQLERVGNLVFLRHSPDGQQWSELPASPITRNDLANVPLQVGLFQATYSNNQGQVSFDNFVLEQGGQVRTARLPQPADGARYQPAQLQLQWVPGSGAREHEVYVGTNLDAVRRAGRHSEAIYRGRQPVTKVSFPLADLKGGHTYFWRIDEVLGDDVVTGEVWNFSVYDKHLETFEEFEAKEALTSRWTVNGDGDVELSTQARSGRRAIKLNCRGESCSIEHLFLEPQDWLSSAYGLRSLQVWFHGQPENEIDSLYLACEDADWGTARTVVQYEGDPTHLTEAAWTCWDIDFQDLLRSNPTFRLDRVSKLLLGIKRRGPANTGEPCVVLFDDLSVQTRRDRTAHAAAWPNYVQPSRFVTAVPFGQVSVTGGLWRERMDVNRTVSLPHVWKCCEQFTKANGDESRRLDNFRKAAGLLEGEFTGTYFNDSDVYKILEGTANSLQNHPDPELEKYADQVIDWIAAAQWEDGYLYSFYSLPQRKPEARWTNVGSMHELYCAGHLIEAGVAYHEATGKRKLLDVAIRFADLICETFASGKRETAPGHQEIELALVRLYRKTGEQRYLDTARFFVDQRGRGEKRPLYGTYSQDHLPFVEQQEGVGHSVRAGYLFCAATEIATLSQDEAYANALFRLWDNIVNRKIYLTGGIGQPGGPEGFAGDYQLGNSCYAETCSGIAFAMWNHRLHQMTGDAKYADLMERTLLNNMLSALSREGDKHYYTNPLMTGGRERWQWPGHDCACCPSNLVRVISSIGGLAFTHNEDTILINQYVACRGSIALRRTRVDLIQQTDYPWHGEVRIQVRPETAAEFGIKLRIPGWARNQPLPGNLYKYLDASDEAVTVFVNDAPADVDVEGGYVELRRRWAHDDVIRLHLPMPVRRVIAHPRVTADKGLVAVERGPLVYCAEFKDNTIGVGELKLSDEAQLTASFDDQLFGGVVTITADTGLKLIPYYLYSNRGSGWMRVWMPRVEVE